MNLRGIIFGSPFGDTAIKVPPWRAPRSYITVAQVPIFIGTPGVYGSPFLDGREL